MRIKNTSLNVIFDVIQLLVTTILTFVTRTFFIRYLGSELIGLDGLFVNLLSMLSLAELGCDTAICYSLYKPLADKDYKKISVIMTLYKKFYYIVGFVILIIGLCMLPIIPAIATGYTAGNIYLYFILYLANTVLSYALAYKEILIVADQKAHKTSRIKTVFLIIMYITQIILLVKTKSFAYYLVAAIVINFGRNLFTNIYITKQYKDVDFKSKDKVDDKLRKSLFHNTKDLFISRIGDYLLNGTDNIIISAINITLTGIYSNYLSITGIMRTAINIIYNGVTSSIGNVMVTEKQEVQERIFNISCFISFFIAGFVSIELIFLFNPVITIWASFGQWTDVNYVLPFWISIVIAMNYYFYSQTRPLSSLKIASGKYKADRFVPIYQAIVNLAVSIVLGYYMGIGGVVLGTLVSYILVGCVFRPLILIKAVFKKSSRDYFLKELNYLITLFFMFVINYFLFKFVNLDNSILLLICKGMIIAVIYLITTYVLYRKDNSYDYIFNMLKKVIRRKHESN